MIVYNTPESERLHADKGEYADAVWLAAESACSRLQRFGTIDPKLDAHHKEERGPRLLGLVEVGRERVELCLDL